MNCIVTSRTRCELSGVQVIMISVASHLLACKVKRPAPSSPSPATRTMIVVIPRAPGISYWGRQYWRPLSHPIFCCFLVACFGFVQYLPRRTSAHTLRLGYANQHEGLISRHLFNPFRQSGKFQFSPREFVERWNEHDLATTHRCDK